MIRAAKWIGIIVGTIIVLCIAAVILVPMLVDLNNYKPVVEKKVSEATGRPFSLVGDIKLSLFPWAGISLSDLHLGNPAGYKERDFVSVKSFEIRVKVLPLIRKRMEVERFVLVGPMIYLHKDSKGRGNWEGLGKPEETRKELKKPSAGEAEKAPSELPLAALAVGEFSVRDGSLVMVDDSSGSRRELSGIAVELRDVSLDRPINLSLSAKMDGKPLSLEGSLGPIGKIPGMGTVAVDLALKALGELNASVKGKVVDPALARKFDLAINVSRFSPRKIMDSLGRKFPASTSDPEALKRVSLDMHVSGDTASLIIKDGVMELDDSKINFSASLAEFERPKAKFEISLDRIDLDRYMPPASEEKSDQKGTSGSKAEKGKTDYSSMRRPVIEGSLKVGELKIKGARAENILLTVDARDGLFQVKPLKMNLYRGDLMIKAQYDVRSDLPLIAADITAERIQARPLLNDLAKKDFIEGTAKASVEVRSRGEDPAVIKQNLNGRGELVFADGAIVGIDLAGMLRNVKATFGLEKKSGEKPRTDFSELKVPFTIENGIAQTESTSIASPLLRVTARGKADLVKETLDFRVEPKLVGTLKGQGDTSERSGLMVPVLVTGTFSSPSFAPDLEGLLKEGLDKGLNDPSKLKEQLKDMIPQKGPEKPPEDMKLNLPFKR